MRGAGLHRPAELRATRVVPCEPGCACRAQFVRPETARWQVTSAAAAGPTSLLDGGSESCSSCSLRRVKRLLCAQRVRPSATHGSEAVAAAAPSLCCGSKQLPANCQPSSRGCFQPEALVATPRRSHAAATLRLPAGRCQRAARSSAHKRLQQRLPLLSWCSTARRTPRTVHFHST